MPCLALIALPAGMQYVVFTRPQGDAAVWKGKELIGDGVVFFFLLERDKPTGELCLPCTKKTDQFFKDRLHPRETDADS